MSTGPQQPFQHLRSLEGGGKLASNECSALMNLHESSFLIQEAQKHSKTLTSYEIVNESNYRSCDDTSCVIAICPWLLDILVFVEPSGAICSQALRVSEHFFKNHPILASFKLPKNGWVSLYIQSMISLANACHELATAPSANKKCANTY